MAQFARSDVGFSPLSGVTARSADPGGLGLLARILMNLAEPGAHLVRGYREHSVAARANRRRLERPIECPSKLPNPDLVVFGDDLSSDERRAAGHPRARLVGLISESDQLLCDVGADMKIVAAITEPAAWRRCCCRRTPTSGCASAGSPRAPWAT